MNHYAVCYLMHLPSPTGIELNQQLYAVWAASEEEAFATGLGLAEQCLAEQELVGFTVLQKNIICLHSNWAEFVAESFATSTPKP